MGIFSKPRKKKRKASLAPALRQRVGIFSKPRKKKRKGR